MKKYLIKNNLKSQLVLISSISLLTAALFVLIILPIITKPFYENNIYQVLKHPTNYINSDLENTNKDIAYIINNNKTALVSNNFYKILGNCNLNEIINLTNSNYGKFHINKSTYYYYKVNINNNIITTFMNDGYIKTQQTNLNSIVVPTIFITILITISILIIYSNYLVKKITKLKIKIDNLNNENFNHEISFKIEDELQILNESIEQMRLEINEREKYKNNMFQSISHELKTPITVISSYTEALKDKVIKEAEALPIIEEEINKLNNYVRSILELNKIAFIKSNNKLKDHKIDIVKLINKQINKFKLVRKDVKTIIESKENYNYIGTIDTWEMIFDNIMSNFLRYADKEIKITILENKLILFNDGEHIEKKVLKNIFKPYEKGNDGHTGLGLSIVYMTLDMLNYSILVINTESGVEFHIEKRS